MVLTRLDFPFVMKIILSHYLDGVLSDEHNNPVRLQKIFARYFRDEERDKASISKWLSGKEPLPRSFVTFYTQYPNNGALLEDTENLLEQLNDPAEVCMKLQALAKNDKTISAKKMAEFSDFPYDTNRQMITKIASILLFAIGRKHLKHDDDFFQKLQTDAISKETSDFMEEKKMPNPCRHFVGREKELEEIGQLLDREGKLFLHGVGGIGKSELAKAYAKSRASSYTNQVLITYSGSLQKDIANLNFYKDSDDLFQNETVEERFERHHKELLRLKKDTLLIIDNFNTREIDDPTLPAVLSYRCHVLFTTQSIFDDLPKMELFPLDKKSTTSLVRNFYKIKRGEATLVKNIIEKVYGNTLMVELCARHLGRSTYTVQELWNVLQNEALLNSDTNKIKTRKDHIPLEETFFTYACLLLDGWQLTNPQIQLLQNLSLIPLSGITIRNFCALLGLENENELRSLIEMGLIRMDQGNDGTIFLHPLIQRIIWERPDTKPCGKSCGTLIENIREASLCHEREIIPYRTLLAIVDHIISRVQDYDKRLMLTFLEDAFTQAQNYRNIRLMRALFERRKEMMDQCSVSDAQDFALLYHDQAVLLAFIDTPPNYPEAVSFLKKGLETLSEVTTENAELKLNCYTNLCAIYLRMEEKELAAETGMEGERFLKSFPFGEGSASNCTAAQVNFIYSKIPVTGIAEAGKQLLGVKRSLDESPMDRTHNLDYATLLINISNIFYKLQDISYWEMYIPQIAEIYKQIFGKNSPEYKEKIANLRGYCPDEVDFDHIIKCRKGSK